MCGIIGYAGHRPAAPVVVEGLERLEYRGYDSAGIAWAMPDGIHVARAQGKLSELKNKLAAMPPIHSTCAMGHTRWATHGVPAERNAHPHSSNDGRIAIVHNGIIENFQDLKAELLAKGYTFQSETDTEVLANLIQEKRKTEPDMFHAFAAALRQAKGAWAVCMLDAERPGEILAARSFAPLIAGLGDGETFVASDIPAFLPYTRRVVFLEDGDIVQATAAGAKVFRVADLSEADRPAKVIQWDMQAAQKDGFRHFMLKEIFEQPKVIRDGLGGRVRDGRVEMPELAAAPPKALRIVACGTSWHAGLWAAGLFEDLARIPCRVEIASEFRNRRDPLLEEGGAAIFISQSGETADTLAALRLAKAAGARTIGVCNVIGSSLAREAGEVIYTQAGPEISVASTKAMASQMLALALMAIYWSPLDAETRRRWLDGLADAPKLLDDNLPEMRRRAHDLALKYAEAKNFFFLGRGGCCPLALEGALKLKELSYIHAEGYAAGEMKHGPIALIDPAFPTFALAPRDGLFSKMKSNIEEIEARAGKVIVLTNPGSKLAGADVWEVPAMPGWLQGFMLLPCLQLFAYEMADYLGKDVDQPRNLAKSVTVE